MTLSGQSHSQQQDSTDSLRKAVFVDTRPMEPENTTQLSRKHVGGEEGRVLQQRSISNIPPFPKNPDPLHKYFIWASTSFAKH